MANYKSKYKGQQIDNLLDFVNTNKDDIAMQSDIPTVPSDISDFNNDSGFIDNTVNNLVNYYLKTETYTQSEINALVSAAASGGFVKVNELPTEDINIKAIYLVPYTGSRAKNLYEEYIYIDSDWEMIGTTKIDLSNYITTEALSTALADYVLTTDLNTLIANYYNKTEIAGLLSDKVDTSTVGQANGVASLDNNGKVPSSQLPEQGGGDVPTKTSQLTNDSGFITKDVDNLTNYYKKTEIDNNKQNKLTEGDGIDITEDVIAIDPMPAEDVDEVVDIIPSGGRVAVTGYVPLGTLISYYGETAPRFFLACDGATYNKADYPELAEHLLSLTNHSQYEVSGDATKFKVPDMRGEFVRMTGTNSHANQGSGAAVGVHQNGTEFNQGYLDKAQNRLDIYGDENSNLTPRNRDSNIIGTGKYCYSTVNWATYGTTAYYTSRPTNTSVLFCIAYKDIYSNPMNDYSTDEKVVGTWIDGSTIYQKTVVLDSGISFADKGVTAIFNILEASTKNIVDMRGTFSFIYSNTGRAYTYSIGELHRSDNTETDYLWSTLDYNDDSNSKYVVAKIVQTMHTLGTTSTLQNITVTIQYTKTT